MDLLFYIFLFSLIFEISLTGSLKCAKNCVCWCGTFARTGLCCEGTKPPPTGRIALERVNPLAAVLRPVEPGEPKGRGEMS